MREKKNREERLKELEFLYYGSDFEFNTIVDLEMEYEQLTEKQPEHTKRRREILDMRNRQFYNLKPICPST